MRALGIGAAAALALFCFSAPLRAMELVVFQSDRSLVVEDYSQDGDEVLLTLPGGGQLGVPLRTVRTHYPGYVPPRGLTDPAKELPKNLPYREIIGKYCQKYSMDCKLVAALIKVESNFNASAVSPKGAEGLMQLMPETQREEGVTNPFDPEQNIRAGVHYLRHLLDAFQGDLELTLAAYNAGIRRVQADQAVPPIAETQLYVLKILALYPTL
ncbi:MAG: lytic transglycosylase domain-containing protein [Acidobacteriota bacterium]